MIPWEQIKNYWRNEFHQTEIYTDENEHIIVFKNSDTYIILGYLHYNSCFWMSANGSINFIDFIKKLGTKSYNPFKIYLLCNCSLLDIKKSDDLLALPNNVDYFNVNYNSFYETIEFKLENQIQSAKRIKDSEQVNKPWYLKKGISLVTDSRFEEWDKWECQNYKREWYEWDEDEEFESNWIIGSIASMSEIYIDERLLGFYVVYKY